MTTKNYDENIDAKFNADSIDDDRIHIARSVINASREGIKKKKTLVKNFRVLVVIATISIIIGLILTGFWRVAFHYALASQLKLRNDTSSQSYAVWNGKFVDSAHLYFKVYMFNWTNPEASLSKEEKPKFDEIGPYVFRLRFLRDKIIWNNNDTVSFREKRKWNFVPERSIGSLSDKIAGLNVVSISVANKFKNTSRFVKILVNRFIQLIEPSSLYIIKTVGELLFDGYDDNILRLGKLVKKLRIKAINEILSKMKIPDKFGWYYGKNNSMEPDFFNVYTGMSDANKLGLLHSWNYRSRCNAYLDDCDTVNGSTGVLWPLDAATKSTAPLFISDMCGHFDLTRVGLTEFHGVSGVRFEGTNATLDNGTKTLKNRCYCANNSCQWKSGVRDVSECVGAPIFVSFPHFYAADATYRDEIVGMVPNADKHKFGLTLQQDSGLVIDANARLQINVLLEPIDGFSFLANVPKVFIPTTWFEQVVELAPDLIDQLRLYFFIVPLGLTILGITLVSLGAISIIIITQRTSCKTISYKHTSFI